MKTLWSKVLMLALICAISTTFTACSDDDDDDNNNSGNSEQQQQEQEDKTQKFWSVVSQLVGSDVYTEDYAGQSFEPTIGKAESEGSLVRVVQTNDLQTAALRFANLTGATIDEDTPSYTYDDPDVGTLTYTRVADGNTWATVDVDIKQIPHLQQIVYRASSGENGSFGNVKAYYRFGDIVKRTVEGKQEYWICVRPAFTYEGKEDSHWVCVNSLPKKNIFHHDGTNELQYNVPKGIGQDKENMQNFAEMLYAIFNSGMWQENLSNHQDGKLWGFSGMPIFTDFKGKNAKYHNYNFWSHVQNAWYYLNRRDGLIKKAFGVDYADLKEYMSPIDGSNPELHLLYDGYSWLTTFSWNLTLKEAIYSNGTGKKANMHNAVYKEIKKDVSEFGVDVCSGADNRENYVRFFDNADDDVVDDNYRWVIRHATGKQLNGGRDLSPDKAIGNGVTTAYRYYDYYPQEYKKQYNGNSGPECTEAFTPELDGEVSQPLDIPQIGAIIGADGRFYRNTASAKKLGNGAVAVVCTLNGDERVESLAFYNGLAMGIEVLKGDWIAGHSGNCHSVAPFGNLEEPTKVLDGLEATAIYANVCIDNHSHPLAKKLYNGIYPRQLEDGVQASGVFSSWFIPSIGQFILAMKGFGLDYDDKNGFNSFMHMDEIEKLRKMLRQVGIEWEDNFCTEEMLTSTMCGTAVCCVSFMVEMDVSVPLAFIGEGYECSTIPFLAFKYDGGAKK